MIHSPQQLKQLIVAKKFNIVEKAIIDIVNFSTEKKNYIKLDDREYIDDAEKVVAEEKCIQLMGAYASVIIELFGQAKYEATAEILTVFMARKETVDQMFSLSRWRSTDVIIEQLSLLELLTLKKNQLTKRKTNKLKTLLALYGLNSKYSLPWVNLFKLMPQATFEAYVGIVTQSISTLTKSRDERFGELLAQSKEFPIIPLRNEETIHTLAAPYFSCSYTNNEDKYQFKRWMAKLMDANAHNWLSKEILNFQTQCEQRAISDKPTIGVVLEVYNTSHAMFRCFNRLIKDLGRYYRLIAFLQEPSVGEIDTSAFDDTVWFKVSDKLNTRALAIKQQNVDMLFYPSIGMATWSLCLSYVRLAPVQFMTGGHPSSSFSPVIDYFIMPGNVYAAEDVQPFMNETVIMENKPQSALGYVTRHPLLDDEQVAKLSQFLETDEKEITVGINGVLRKVSYELLDVCRTISSKTNKRVKFVFFSFYPEFHLSYFSAKQEISSILDNFVLEGYSSYVDYMETISQCHLLLPTFPFGGSNSNIDAMLLNKPKLFLRLRKQIYTRSDEVDWVCAGLDDHMGCDSVGQLVEKAVELIEDDTLRFKYHQVMSEQCPSERLFYVDGQSEPPSISAHVEKMLKHYESTNTSCSTYESEVA